LPAAHWAVALAKEQPLPHWPQLVRVVLRSTSQPLVASTSQSPQPAVHAAREHLPPAHDVVAWGKVQVQPHWFLLPAPSQVSPVPQVPQSIVVQPLLICPHVALICEQVLGVHPHWLSLPDPPQLSGAVHLPQSNAWEHPSETGPHEAPSCEQVLAVQVPVPHRFGPPPPHVWPEGQVPQSFTPPHWSGTDPHVTPSWAHDLGLHPHSLSLPFPPHCPGGVQPPQSIAVAQPSEAYPHEAPTCAQVLGAHGLVPHLLTPPPPHNWPVLHVPQSIFPPHPSGAEPQSAEICAHVFGTQPPPSTVPSPCTSDFASAFGPSVTDVSVAASSAPAAPPEL